jgi:hypothetical protein
MCRGNAKGKRNGRRQRIIAVSILMILVLLVVLSWLLPHMSFAELVELPVRTPTRTVVSLSTFSQRVFQMRRTLDSIFAQSQFPDRVIITIPRTFRTLEPTTTVGWNDISVDPTHYNETEQSMVAWFSDYMGYIGTAPVYRVNVNVHRTSYVYDIGVLTVQFLDDDWGPGTKLVGALLLETHPDTVVITLDDDVVYHRDTVQWLATHMQENIALSFACEMWRTDRSGTVCFGMWTMFDFAMTTPRVCDGWLSGWAAAAYHVSSFGPDIWTFAQSLPAGCFNNDDMWLSAYICRHGITRIFAPNVLHHLNHARNLEYSLSTIVDHNDKSNSCARALFPSPELRSQGC